MLQNKLKAKPQHIEMIRSACKRLSQLFLDTFPGASASAIESLRTKPKEA
jgi:hypothetical protein